jgi:hypothetical protein
MHRFERCLGINECGRPYYGLYTYQDEELNLRLCEGMFFKTPNGLPFRLPLGIDLFTMTSLQFIAGLRHSIRDRTKSHVQYVFCSSMAC